MNKMNKKMKEEEECFTFHGLNKWYKREFENLGWMILAKNKGMTEKLEHYKKSLQHLKSELESKLKKTKDTDKKDDILIMWKNVNILIEHVNIDF